MFRRFRRGGQYSRLALSWSFSIALEALFRDAGPPVEVKRGGVRRDHLGAQHAFHRVQGIHANLPRQSAERTLDGRRRHRTAGIRERARQLRRQVLVPLVILAAESAKLFRPPLASLWK